MAQLLLCLALADAFLGLAMASEKVQTMVQSSTASSSPQQAPTQNLYDAQAPMIRRLGKHHHQKMVQTVVAPGLSPSLAPHQAPENVHSKRETSPLYQTKSSSEASSAEESVSIQVQATHLPNHHHSADKSIAGGGVILGGLATTFLVAVFCYIRATGRHKAGGATS
ncbi:F3L24.15 PROTEIN [Salix purpurea]|uniref:F3L24.15 PROTEIN n=1 Tax=Salix purpurea TaxID=77065 RepID=A0A9Q0VW89_SALPP|nr:F3L24.15 PROTEIN [Salix purpurea]